MTPAPSFGIPRTLRQSLRLWRREWPLALVIALTMAIGIGATTSVFSVVYGVLLRPLPFPEEESLVFLWEANQEIGLPQFPASPLGFRDWRAETQEIFSAMAATERREINLTGLEQPRRLSALAVSGGYFEVLGVRPLAGSLLDRGDEGPGAPRHAVLSRSLWQNLFGGEAAVAGRTIRLDGEAFTVRGVAPDDLRGNVDIWVPMDRDPATVPRGDHFLVVLARRGPGVSAAVADHRLQSLAAELAERYPDENEGWTIWQQPVREALVRRLRPSLLALQGAVAALLLIAALNVANLLTSIAARRRRELALHRALGAGTAAVVARSLVESLVPVFLGGVGGLLLAALGTRALVDLFPGSLPGGAPPTLSPAVLLAGLALTLVTALIVGLLPAAASRSGDLSMILRSGGDAAAAARGRRPWLRAALVVAQVAVALVLVAATLLLGSALSRLAAIDPGFRPQGALTLEATLPEGSYGDADQRFDFWRRAQEEVLSLPGVQAAGTIFPLPLSGGGYLLELRLPGQEALKPGELPVANIRWISAGAVEALGIPLLEGRALEAQDGTVQPAPALVNRTMAAKLWPGRSALGETFQLGNDEAGQPIRHQIVGVVGDVRHDRLQEEGGMELYLPSQLCPEAVATLVVRTSTDPASLQEPIRNALGQLDPQLPLYHVRTLDNVVQAALGPARFNSILFRLFALLALILAGVGVYGVVHQAARQRQREFAIRLALGCRRQGILALVLGWAAAVAGLGVILGAVGSHWAGKALGGLLYGVPASQPAVVCLAAGVLLAMALAAALVPALRAMKVDPAAKLREE